MNHLRDATDIEIVPPSEPLLPPRQDSALPKLQLLLSRMTLTRLRGGLLLVIGYLLSPLCWWNDLIFNLPIAYLFGYLCSLIVSDWLLPGAIAGYWLSNIVGILLMQFGVVDVFQGQTQEHNLKKELITGVITSTLYTLLILALVHFHVLELPALFSSKPV